MKTLRHYRISLGRFMIALVAFWQVTQPLNAVDYIWDPAANGSGSGGPGTWDDSTSIWYNGVTDVGWNNAAFNTAVFGGTGGQVGLSGPKTVGGLTFNTTGYYVFPNDISEVITFDTGTATVPVISLGTGVSAEIATPIAGSDGLVITGLGASSVLKLQVTDEPPINYANTLTGGITISNATLSTKVSSTVNPLRDSNTLARNTITLQTGAVLDLTPESSTGAGLSERAFGNLDPNLVGGNSSRFDFTSVANKTLLFVSTPPTDPPTLVDVSTRVNTNGLNNGSMYSAYGDIGTLVDTVNSLNNTAYQWVGKLRILAGGTYQFGTASDDGSRLFVDGILVVNNDGGKGVLDSSNFITLSAGLHDIRIDNVNGTGGTGEVFRYGGPDQAYGNANAGALTQAEINTAAGSSTAIQMLNALNVTGNSTINLNGGDFTQVQFGNFTINTNNTLTVGGLAGKTMRVGAATLGNGTGNITFDAAPNIAFDGVVSDGGNAMVINKLGVGRLIFDQTAVANNLSSSTVINMQAGELVLVGSPVAGSFNPIGNAQITLSGGNLVLDSKGGNGAVGPTYNNAINVTANATIQSINNAATTTLGGTNGITIGAAATLTLDAITGALNPVGSLPATLTIAGAVSGTATSKITFKSTNLGTAGTVLPGVFNVSGDFSNYAGDFSFTGTSSVTVTGNLNLKTGSSANFDVATTSATIAGLISGAGVSVTKDGTGTLFLSGNNSYTGGTIMNAGALQISGTNSALGTGTITINGGTLSFLNNGNASGGANTGIIINYGNAMTVSTGVTGNVSIGNQGAGTGNTMQFGKLTLTDSGQDFTFTSANGYNLRFMDSAVNAIGDFNVATAGSTLTLLTGTGQTRTVAGVGTTTLNSVTYNNTGAGTLVIGTGAQVNKVTTFGSGPYTFNAGTNNVYLPTANPLGLSATGYTSGGLMVRQTSYGTAPNLNSAAASGTGPVAAFLGGVPLGDAVDNNRPALGITAGLVQTNSTYSGLLEITTAGLYGFRTAVDDASSLFIDGTALVSVNVNGGGQGLIETATTYIYLEAGFHQFNFKSQNQGSGGGFNVLYSGPDTASSGQSGGFQNIPGSKLYGTTSLGSAANGYLNAAQIADTFQVDTATSSTIDGQGTDYNLTFGALNLAATSTLVVQNQFGSGFYGVTGTTTVQGAGVTVSPTSGTLALFGGIVDSGNGLTKTGAGTLVLGNSASFTGAFNINAGYVMLAGTTALSSGANTVLSGAQLDLYGVSGVVGNITINGTGVAGLVGADSGAALWNSLVGSTASLAAGSVLTVGSASRIGGVGDITINGTINDGAALGLTKTGNSTLTLNGNNTAFTGVLTFSTGVLKLGHAGALGTAAGTALNKTIMASGTVLDLNGQNIASELFDVAGAGYSNRSTAPNTLGAIINSSNTAATLGGNITMTAATSIGSNRLNATSGVATAGDITISGTIGGTFGITKVGANTLTLTANNSTGLYTTTTINGGTIRVSGANGRLGSGATTINGYGATPGTAPTTGLVLDNTTDAVSTRLADAQLQLRSGNLTIIGNAATAVDESIGATNLDLALGHSVISLDSIGAGVTLRTAGGTGTLLRSGSATLLVRGDNLGTAAAGTPNATNLIFGTAPAIAGSTDIFGATSATGILPWVIVDTSTTAGTTGIGTSFGWIGTNGLTALAAGNYASALPAIGTANSATDINLKPTTNLTLSNAAANQNLLTTGVNSLTLDTVIAGSAITIGALQNLSLDSGGILATASNTISGPGYLNVAGNRQAIIHTIGASTTLTLDVALGGKVAPTTGGLAKAGDGTLVLGVANSYTGATNVNQGTLKLGTGAGTNAIFYNFTTGPASNSTVSGLSGTILAISPGGTFDLNGNSQAFNRIQGNGGSNLAGAAGIITNTGANATLTVVADTNVDWQGSIQGNTNFVRQGGNPVNNNPNIFQIYDNNTYTGATYLMGGVTSLVGQGRLSGTSEINVNRAVLLWNDTGDQQLTNRINTSATINLNGGAINYLSRAGTNGVATLGNINLVSGTSYIAATPTAGTATIAMGTLSRATGATVGFAAGSGSPGENPFFTFTTAPTLTNGIMGGWAVAYGSSSAASATTLEFATYDAANGVRQLTGGNQTTVFAAGNNVKLAGSAAIAAGGAIINSLTLNANAGQAITFLNATDVLNVQSGGILGGLDNQTKTLGTIALPGRITAGGVNPVGPVELFLTQGGGNMQVNSIITDNPTNGAVLNLVLSSGGRTDNTSRISLANANTYTGTTYINGVRVDLRNTTGIGNAITGDFVLQGGVNATSDSTDSTGFRLLNFANNQIADTANAIIRGNGNWDIFGFTETINNLTFYNDGGSQSNRTSTVQTGVGVLTLNGNINATNLINAAAISILTGNLNLGADNAITINVDAVTGGNVQGNEQVGLAFNSNIRNATSTVTKTGLGAMQLGGQSSTVGTLNVTAGAVTILAATNYKNTTLNLSSGTKLDARGNTMSTGSLGNITGTGTIYNFHPTAGGTIVTGSANADATFGGIIDSGYTTGLLSITKVGTGIWTLTGDSSNGLAATLTVNQGTVNLTGATGKVGFQTYTIAAGGALTLNNSTNVVSNRLGNVDAENSVSLNATLATIGSANVNVTVPVGDPTRNTVLNFRGGTVNLIGGSSAVQEVINDISIQGGSGTLNITGGSAATSLLASTVAASGTGGLLRLNALGGTTLGTALAGAGIVNFAATTPNLVGGGAGVGIRADIIGSDNTGIGFVTSDANGFRLLAASEYRTPDTRYLGNTLPLRFNGIVSPPVPVNVATTDNVKTALLQNFDINTTINSLTLSSGGGINSTGGGLFNGAGAYQSPTGMDYNAAGGLNTLTVSSGGILTFTGNTGLNNGAITSGGTQLSLITEGDTISSAYLLGTGGIMKAGAGKLTLNERSLNTGTVYVNEGILELNAGRANTLVVTSTATSATLSNLNVNGGSVNLMGQNQFVGQISQNSGNTYPGMAGGITSVAPATLTTSTQAGSVTYSGVVSGALTVDKVGANTWTLNTAQTYTGTTNVRGGGLTLASSASLASDIVNVNYGTLTMDETQFSTGVNRLKDTATLNLSGASLIFTPNSTSTVETIGNVNLQQGTNILNFTAVQLGGSYNLNAGVLTQSNGATLIAFPGTGSMGRGNSDNGDQSPQVTFTNGAAVAAAMINNVIAYGVHNGTDLLTYQNTATTTGAIGLAGFADTNAGIVNYTNSTATAATITGYGNANNQRIQNGSYTLGTGTLGVVNYNALVWNVNGDNQTITFATGTDTLYLTAGTLIRSGNNPAFIGSGTGNGKIAAGASGAAAGTYDLYLYNNQNTLTVRSKIVDNSATALTRLVLSGNNAGTIVLADANTHTGGTIVNAGNTVQLNAAGAISLAAAPASGLIINGGIVTTNVVAAINTGNTVVINGSGSLNLANTAAGTNALAGLVFNNTGGGAAPTVTVGVAGSTLNISGGSITSTSTNLGFAPIITGGTLQFSSTTGDFNVTNTAGNETPGLTIASVLAQGSVVGAITKSGTGSLALTAANTFTGGFNLNAGEVVIGNNAAFGTNVLTIANGTSLRTDNAAKTITNAITINGDFTITGALVAHSITQTTGAILLGAADRKITVDSPLVTLTLGGVIGSTGGGLIKDGAGIMTLTNALNTYTGGTTVNNGILKAGVANALPVTSALTVKSSGLFDLNNFAVQVASLSGEDATHGGVITNSSGTNRILTISNTSGTSTFAGIITSNTAANLSLTKAGASTQILAGANTYTGATTVSAGALLVNGSLANTVVSVAAGATIGGTGVIGNTLGGSVTVTAATAGGGGIVDLSTDSAIGTLTINGLSGSTALTMGSATTLNHTVLTINTSTNSTDQIIVGNNARVNIAGTATSGLQINLVGIGGSTLANGVYNLISYDFGNGLGGVLGTIGTPTGVFKINDSSNASTTTFNVTGSALQLIVGGTSNYYWNGDVNTSWSAAGNTNWLNAPAGGDPGTLPGSADTVIFNADGANTSNLNTTLGANFSINALNFGAGNNTAANAVSIDTGNNTLTINAGGITQASGSATNTIQSTGAGGVVLLAGQQWTNNSINDLIVSAPISGNAGLGINNTSTGKTILTGTNTYTGNTTITAGTLQLGDGTTDGSVVSSTITNNGALIFNTVGTKTNSSAITGTGSVTKTGLGTQVLTGSSSYSGGTTISQGVVQTGGRGLGTGLVTVASGATLSVSGTTGLAAEYYNITPTNVSNSSPNFNTLAALQNHLGGNQAPNLVNTTTTVNFGATGSGFPGTYGSGTTTNFEGYFSGKINITTAATYSFNTSSDDGSMLWIDGVQVVNNNFFQGVTTRSGTIDLTAGYHDIVVAFYQGTGGYGMNAQINGADISTANVQITPDLVIGALAGAGNVNLTTGNIVVGTNNGTASYTGVISGIGGLMKVGTGAQTLGGNSTYTGYTIVNAGTLQVGNGGVGQTGTGLTSVNGSAAVLSGSGTVQGATTVIQGSIRPGDAGGASTGTLNFSNGLTYTGGSTVLQISGANDIATERDNINVTGTLTLSSASNIQVLFSGGFTPSATTYSWNLLDWSTTLVQGGFDVGTNLRNGTVNEGNLDLADISSLSGYAWDVSNFFSSGVVSIVQVPEPSRVLLLLFGLMALFFRRRRSSPIV